MHDGSHADEHGGLHLGVGRFRLGLRLAHQAAPGLRLRRTLGAAGAFGSDDFWPKSVGYVTCGAAVHQVHEDPTRSNAIVVRVCL